MKKKCTFLLLMSLSAMSFAQIQPVNYRGAFAPAPTEMWTDGWANWDPQTTTYPAPTITVSGNINTSRTWTRTNVYQLSGLVYVDSLVTLTIESGTIIRGGAAQSNSSLIIKRGAKIIAEGTSTSPIVFTSGLAAGARSRGDWGGLILLGRARTNLPGGVGFIEGLSTNPQLGYGGNDDADNSGILKYVRIELNGSIFAPNSEINGLTMGCVGRGTTIDYVQVSYNQDDSFEWFGGAVNATHLVSYRNLDDDFDTDNGFSGKVQFCLAVRDPNVADAPLISTSEGFESDNDAGASVLTPQTSAVFSNVTVIGPYRGNPAATVATGFRRGARLRRNTALKIFNSIFMDYATGLFIDGSPAKLNAFNGILKYKNNLVALTTPAHRVAEDDSTRLIFFMPANSNDSLSTTAGILTTPYNFTAPDYRPVPLTSPALTNFDFSDAVLPITLVSFTGENVKSDNFLYWETSTEINNTGFEIQRSINGQSYTSLEFVPSLATDGNSTANLKYTYSDRNARSEKSYYRLKQIDKDGRSMLSNIVVLSRTIPDQLSLSIVYPNPVVKGNILNVEIASPKPQTITLVINDAFGRRLTQNKVQLLRGINNHQLNVQSISAGSYYVSISAPNSKATQVRKFIKH